MPLRLNQWCNVVRWEFKHPQPFLRTREFLWQEGHTAFASKAEADKEVLEVLDLYRQVYEDVLAVPVIKGIKSEKEKFSGGLYTTTVEGFIPTTGRGIQGATSHCLGQNFSKMFGIRFENENKEMTFAWQNSWGLTTRTIGVMVMTHGDDKGLVLPPRVAAIQVVIVPCGITAKHTPADQEALNKHIYALTEKLEKTGLKVKADMRDTYSPGYKYNHWEMKGVPVRLEVGPRDVASGQVVAVRRDTGTKEPLETAKISELLPALLEKIQNDMFQRAKQVRDERLKIVENWKDFVPALDAKCLVLAPWCEEVKCEEQIKDRSAAASEPTDDKAPSMGAKTLCIPFDQGLAGKSIGHKCINCDAKAKRWTLFGRSY